MDYGSDFDFYSNGGYVVESSEEFPVYVASRPLYEATVRRLVADIDCITLREECQCIEYLTDETGTAVEGIRIREGDAAEDLRADLVVDATGRTSHTPSWLADNGFEAPRTDEVHIDMAYCSTLIERPPDEVRAFYDLPEPGRSRGALIHPIEGDRWVANLIGMHGDHPPTDPEGFVEFAETLPVDEPARLLRERDWTIDEVRKYPFPNHQRHRYEELDRFPDGLVVVGDAISSFNPMYAQGMSVAALEALQLHHALAAGRDDLALRFFDRAEEVIDIAWSMAVGADMDFDGTEADAPDPSAPAIVDRYMNRLSKTAHSDPAVAEALHEVVRLEKPPSTLFHPTVAWRVIKPTG